MYRHTAYNISTGEIITANTGNHLKRCVAHTKKWDKALFHSAGQWRFSHDYCKSWLANGFPAR